ncbi:MAG: DNA mismatch repair protein MutS, partial [Clostridium sp.]
MAQLSPMMQQYLKIKEQDPNTILFFRLGDFYEMFFEDAKTASKELELTLTGRDCGQEERAPMCGVPYHSSESYIARLVSKGYKVAICEQMEDPATAKGIVKRDIIRVITPGTVMEGSMLDETKNNFICSLFVRNRKAGVCFCDVSTGELYATQMEEKDLESSVKNELGRFMPKEILIGGDAVKMKSLPDFIKDRLSTASVEMLEDSRYEYDLCEETLLKQFEKQSVEQLGLDGKEETVCCLGALLSYLQETQRTGLERMNLIDVYSGAQFMQLDLNTRRNLELLETMRSKEKKGSLLWVLDQTKTAMGKRLIRTWMEQPLVSCAQIIRRQNAVEELLENVMMRGAVLEQLSGVFDMERLMTRIVYGSANGRELRSLCNTLQKLPELKAALEGAKSAMLSDICHNMDIMEDIQTLIDRAIVEDPPFSVREGGIIQRGFHEEIDLLRGDMADGKGVIARIEAQEREKTGIPKLKVGYNRVFGYYIEVTNSYKDQVPENYIRKQTLTNCERYITQELK